MNDFPTCQHHQTGNQFADNTITYAQGDTVMDLQGFIQEDVKNINAWFRLNKLTLKISQSGTMLLGTRQTLRGESELNISNYDEVLSDFNESHYLRLILSSDMSCADYILKLCTSYHRTWELYVV